MGYFVYLLFCDQKTYYVGSTDNVEKRFSEHKNKRSFFTKKFSDLRLVYIEQYATRSRAETREKQIKGWSVAKKRALINGDRALLVRLSKSH